jgi:hypothetical protein
LGRKRPIDLQFGGAAGPKSRHTLFPLFDELGSPSLYLGLHLIGTVDHVDLPEPVVARLACHLLIEQLKDEALREALESLTDAYAVEIARGAPQKPLPQPTRTVKARVGKSVVRPVFPISDEE